MATSWNEERIIKKKVRRHSQQDLHVHTALLPCILTPACIHKFALHVLAGLRAHMFSSLIMKWWNAASRPSPRENELCNKSPRKCFIACVFFLLCALCVCFCHSHEFHPVLIKTGFSFYIITECGRLPSADSLIIFVVCCSHNPAPGAFTTLLSLPIALLPSVIYYTPSFSSPFPPSLTPFISLTHLPPTLPMLPKKYALNFYPTDRSGASWLPPPRLLVCFLCPLPPRVLPFPFLSFTHSTFISAFVIHPFPISPLHHAASLSTPLSLALLWGPCGRVSRAREGESG